MFKYIPTIRFRKLFRSIVTLSFFIFYTSILSADTLKEVVDKVSNSLPQSYLGERIEKIELTKQFVELTITITDIFGLEEPQYQWFIHATKNSDWMRSCVEPFYTQFISKNISVKRIRMSPLPNLNFTTIVNPKDCGYFKGTSNEQLITKYLKEQNKILPIMIDEGTELVRYKQTFGDTIEVTHRMVNVKVESIDTKAFSRIMTENLMPNLCNASDYSTLLDRGIRMVYRYTDMDGTPFFKLPFNKTDC